MAKQKANDISAIASEISKGYTAQIKELHKELNSIRKENIQNIKQVERLRDVIDKNKQAYQTKSNQSNEEIKELKLQIGALTRQNSRQQSALNGIKREYKKKFDTFKEQQIKDREERKAQAEADRANRIAEREQKEADRKAEREAREAKAEAQRQQKAKEKEEKERQREQDKIKKAEEKRQREIAKEFEREKRIKDKEASKTSFDKFSEFKRANREIEIKSAKDISFFNQWASSTSAGVFDDKDKLLELSSGIKPKDTSHWNQNKEIKESVNNFKDLNKTLDKINNKLNLFAVALSALRIWDWGVKHHEETKSNIHSAYEAGLNYRQGREFNSLASTWGTDPQALTAEIKEFRMLKDTWGTGSDLFRNETEQRFLFGNTRGSLRGLNIATLASQDPVRAYETIAKTIYNDMKNRPDDAGTIEAMANKSGYGVIASMMKKSLLGGVDFDDAWTKIKNATDSPFGREQTSFRFSLDLQDSLARLANITDRVIMRFEELAGGMLKFINKLPFFSTGSERIQQMEVLNKEIKENKISSETLRTTKRQHSQGIDIIGDVLGIDKIFDNSGSHLMNLTRNIREKSHLDTDFELSRFLLGDTYKNIADLDNNNKHKQEMMKSLKIADKYEDKVYGDIYRAIEAKDKAKLDEIVSSPSFMKNQHDYNNLRKTATSGDITQRYKNEQINVQSNIILEDRTQGGLIATTIQNDSSTRVDTIGQ